MAQFSTSRNRLLKNNNDTYEVVMVSGQAGPSIYVPKGNLNVGTDAFGRARVSSPFTLFDSSFRYGDSERRWNEKITGTASSNYTTLEGAVTLSVGSDSGDEIIRQTDRVFSYQPGKSLLSMNTFTFAAPKTGLRQRVGYFLKRNGIFLEQDDSTINIVKRSSSTGSVVETRAVQSSWNVDTLDGTGPSGITLDLTKSQIFWVDLEWLGVGSVRCGFVIDGQFILCHIFHHANRITGTYMTTASLSCRYEITNTGATSGSSEMFQICSTVISEGGYTTEGLSRSVSTALAGRQLPKAQTDFPIISIRLRPNRTDAVVTPNEFTVYGLQATAYKYKIVRNPTITQSGGAPTWNLVDSSSSVQYNIAADSSSGGTVLLEGIFKGQSHIDPINLKPLFDHSLQLTRGIIDSDSAGEVFSLVMRATTNNDYAIASMGFQERTA